MAAQNWYRTYMSMSLSLPTMKSYGSGSQLPNILLRTHTYMRALGLERHIGPIHSWGDNFDLVVYTPNGCRMTHAMVTPFVQNPAGLLFPGGATTGGKVMSLKIPRLTKLQAGKLSLAHKSSFSLNIAQVPRR